MSNVNMQGYKVDKIEFVNTMENGSKIALIALAGVLQKLDYLMIDCQFHTDHLASMGGEAISYAEFKKLLDAGINK